MEKNSNVFPNGVSGAAHVSFDTETFLLLVMLGDMAFLALFGASARAAVPILVAMLAYCKTLAVSSKSNAAGLTLTQKRMEPQPCNKSLRI